MFLGMASIPSLQEQADVESMPESEEQRPQGFSPPTPELMVIVSAQMPLELIPSAYMSMRPIALPAITLLS